MKAMPPAAVLDNLELLQTRRHLDTHARSHNGGHHSHGHECLQTAKTIPRASEEERPVGRWSGGPRHELARSGLGYLLTATAEERPTDTAPRRAPPHLQLLARRRGHHLPVGPMLI